jgi:hypothetical protein
LDPYTASITYTRIKLSNIQVFLWAEGFSCLLKFGGPVYLSRGVRVSIHSPWVSHLLFADDSMIFCEASAAGAHGLKGILEIYKNGSC